jgi:HPr kinase/phosphorylase
VTAPFDAANLHAVALVVGEAGALIRGRPGAGKTALALEAVDRARTGGRFARLVADDRVLLTARGGRLLARPHRLLAGLAEERGFGPAAHPHEPACVLRLLVDLGSAAETPGEPAVATLLGVPLPLLRLPESVDRARAARLLLARLGLG